MTSKLEAIQENHRCNLKLVKSGMPYAYGGGGTLLCTSFHLSGEQVQRVALGYARAAQGGTLSLSYQCLLLLLHLSLFCSKLDGG